MRNQLVPTSRTRKQIGASMVEYALVIGLIAGVCLLAIKFMGRSNEKNFWVSCIAMSKSSAPGGGLDPTKVTWSAGQNCWSYDNGPCLKSLLNCESAQ